MLLSLALAAALQVGAPDSVVFQTRFDDASLPGWAVTRPGAIRVEDSGDPARGPALRMVADGPWTHAILEGSAGWGPVRIDGLVRFPTDEHNYLGFIWGMEQAAERTDFASVYIKGNGSYVRTNHRYDGNPLRSLHEERRTPLEGPQAVRIGEWQPFRLEVDGPVAHLYFEDMSTPVVTSDLYMGGAGDLGFKPRVYGGDVWLDDLTVTSIEGLTWQGPARPDIAYRPETLVRDWWVLGPTIELHSELGRRADPTSTGVVDMGESLEWQPFETDRRGAVLTSRVVQFRGPRTRAYFAARIVVEEGGPNVLVASSIDDLTLWVDGRFEGYYNRSRFAWHDMLTNPEHEGYTFTDPLEPGEHWVLVEVRGALYAGGGFFVGLTRPE